MSSDIVQSTETDREYRLQSMRIRAAQSMRTFPVVAASLVGLYFALRGRIPTSQFLLWAWLLGASTLLRAVVCLFVLRHLRQPNPLMKAGDEQLLWVTALLNSCAIGSGFWLVAAYGDLSVQLIMTLLSCFYAIGALVNASSHFPSFAVGTVLHLGQGMLFWMGGGWHGEMQLEIGGPYLAVALLMLGFGAEYSRQFRDSIRIRTENVDLLGRLAADKTIVESALNEARMASESKSRFLAAASHDLRQPLHALTMFVSTMTFHVNTPDARRLLARISDTTRVLEDQFESLLDLSRFEVGAVVADIKPFRLDSVIERVTDEVRADALAKQLALVVQVEPSIANSDPLLVTRVLQNLVQNAVKYSISGSVAVRVTAQAEDYRIDVIDTGPGIPADQQTRIFEEYVQLENPGRQRRYGVGLGLAIVRRIDSLLSLQLSLDSEVGRGSTFSIRVPRAVAETPHSITGPPMEEPTFSTTARIWILDDDPNSLDALEEQLHAWGAEVRAFHTPDELLAAFGERTDRPQWVITDDMLGAPLSGLDVANYLRSQFGHVRVCLITGNMDPHRLGDLRSSGFPLILKPTKPAKLIALLAV